MCLTKKIFIQQVCLIMAVLFFFATTTPAVVRAQANEKKGTANSLCLLKLALAGKNGQAILSKEERVAVKAEFINRAENLFRQIEQSGFSEEIIQNYGYVLPQGFAEKIMMVSDIAQAGMATEEKLQVLQGAFGYSCSDIMYVGVVAFVLSFFGVISYLGYFGSLLFATATLCYLGIF